MNTGFLMSQDFRWKGVIATMVAGQLTAAASLPVYMAHLGTVV